ncbi:polysaccharide deacetylase family protein [Bacillus sp. FJAT-49736]|uniref:polysaccharide deacetylase family protein n=1 Tax=Bacillus sp. FJAT-49736 TaxID=2833582 RepID=UPI001BC9BF85|nr:polysaccharide deacetylase family protein [Bacillus sp. FJAT-49736]MBS4175116.1 polysaccharide deacetylase family protein [Bacillus sp. FJAT-49736]
MKWTARFFLCFLILFLPKQAFAASQVPILVYHSIDEYTGHGSKELYVTPQNFEKQITFLRDHGYTLLTFERWKDMHRYSKPIFITLDDGYKNNLNAFKTFQKLKTEQFRPTATFFVISDFIGRSNRLSKSDLKMLADTGIVSVQSHTATHPDLTKVSDYHDELAGSKEKIEGITGKEVIALSYPYGSYNVKVIEETKKYYKFGITTIPEKYSEKGLKNELYFLPRIYIKYSTTLDEFADIVGK